MLLEGSHARTWRPRLFSGNSTDGFGNDFIVRMRAKVGVRSSLFIPPMREKSGSSFGNFTTSSWQNETCVVPGLQKQKPDFHTSVGIRALGLAVAKCWPLHERSQSSIT